MKKVLIITYYWPPSGGPGVQRWLKFVKYLPEFGITPLVLTVNDNDAVYPQLDTTLASEVPPQAEIYMAKASSLVYNLYKQASPQKEVPYSAFSNETNINLFQKFSRFIRGNFFIPDSRKGWNKCALKEAERLIRANGITTIITTSPPHSSQLIGLELKRQFPEINWISDLRDPWTDIMYYKHLYPTKLATFVDKGYERRVLENADYVVTVSDFLKEEFAKKSSAIDINKIKVITNGYDHADFEIDEVIPEKDFTITFTGNLPSFYTIDAFTDAVKMAIDSGCKIKLRFVGKVSEDKQQSMLKQMPDNVEFVDYVPHSESVKYLLKSSALFHIIPEGGNKGHLAGKLTEYMASRKPIICLGFPEGDVAVYLNEFGSGKVFDYKDVENTYKYICELYEAFTGNDNIDNDNSDLVRLTRKFHTEELTKIIK